MNYRMPAEWERHEATWLSWPTNTITWPDSLLKKTESIYLRMIAALLPGEKVNLLVPNQATGRRVLKALKKTSGLILHETNTVDTWIRDYGPIFVRHLKTKKIAFTKWTFNAWGGKYDDLARDNNVVDRVKALRAYPRFDNPMVLEGGSIDMNGRGTCLTTEQCLLNPNRNPKLTRRGIEKNLEKFLGVKKTIWLKEGIEGDDTDGHVDDITRFVAPSTVVTAVENDRADKNHAILKENLRILKKSTDQDGKRFRIVELPMPGKVGIGREEDPGDRLPASYANFYIGNAAVLLPVYSHSNDKLAARILKKVFPRKKIVPIECTALVYGLGSIHCVTQQQPV